MAKRHFWQIIMLACVTMAAVSCGEDRTHEMEEKTQHNRWMLERMHEQYLWADTLCGFEPAWKDFFAMPADFLKKLTARAGDKWSYVTVDTIAADVHANGHFNHINSYGFDFVLMADPTGQTTKSYARVLTVYPGSPASEAGLRRDDFIASFDGFKLSQKNIAKLEKGNGTTLAVQRLVAEEDEYSLTAEKTVQLGASRRVENVAFPVHKSFAASGARIGYLMCTRLVEGDGDGHEYCDALDNIMRELKSANVNELVLDLRLCNHGTLAMAHRLASHIVNPLYINNVFAKTEYNAGHLVDNKTIAYDSSVVNLGIERVFVIVSDRTQGAAEWMIHCLKCTMGEENVQLVGRATAGQNVIVQDVGNEYFIHLYPAVAYVADADGNHMYGSIQPDKTADEVSFAFLSEYGMTNEPLLQQAMQLMIYGE